MTGHLSLVRLARRRARRVVVSIFVNPAQFAPNEDFASYPRNLDADLAALAKAGVDLVWAPDERDHVSGRALPAASCRTGPAKAGLEDAFRPHFFGGVATVVAKLLIQCAPDIAVFGEKDFQQLKVIDAACRRPRPAGEDRAARRSCASPTGSRCPRAMSTSRPRNAQPRRRCIACSPTARSALRTRNRSPRVLDEGGAAIEAAGFTLDYLEARHADTLAKVESMNDGPIRLLVAARLGATRLIDNVAV